MESVETISFSVPLDGMRDMTPEQIAALTAAKMLGGVAVVSDIRFEGFGTANDSMLLIGRFRFILRTLECDEIPITPGLRPMWNNTLDGKASMHWGLPVTIPVEELYGAVSRSPEVPYNLLHDALETGVEQLVNETREFLHPTHVEMLLSARLMRQLVDAAARGLSQYVGRFQP